MCLTCGCKKPHDNHGKPEYLTIEQLERSARVDNLSIDAAMKNVIEAVEIAKKEPQYQSR